MVKIEPVLITLWERCAPEIRSLGSTVRISGDSVRSSGDSVRSFGDFMDLTANIFFEKGITVHPTS